MATKKKQHVIVRCSAAGVRAGYLEKKTNDATNTVVLSEARRLWKWWSYFSLSELALHGPKPDKINENRYAEPVPSIEIAGWCEILPCSISATKAIQAVPNENR